MLQLARKARRPAGHQLSYRGVFIQLRQHCTDSDQGQSHRNVEILRRPWRHVVGVGLDGHGVGVHVGLKGICALYLANALQEIVVALVEYFDDALVVLPGKLEPQPVVLDPLAPQLAHFRFGFRPGFLLPCELVALILLEIEPLLEQSARIREALGRALLVEIENGERNGKVFLEDGVAEPGAIAGKLVDVGLNEEELLGIERFQILVEYLLRQARRRAASPCSGNGPALQRPSAPPGPLAVLASTPADTAFPRRGVAPCTAVDKAKTNHSSFRFIRAPSQGTLMYRRWCVKDAPLASAPTRFDSLAGIWLPRA